MDNIQPDNPNADLTLTDIVLPLYNVKGWMRLIGVISIITGIIQCLTCIGLLYGWLPIWMGVLMMGTATAIEQAHDTRDPRQIVVAQKKVALYLKIMGVLALLGIFVAILIALMAFIAPFILQPLIERIPELQQHLR